MSSEQPITPEELAEWRKQLTTEGFSCMDDEVARLIAEVERLREDPRSPTELPGDAAWERAANYWKGNYDELRAQMNRDAAAGCEMAQKITELLARVEELLEDNHRLAKGHGAAVERMMERAIDATARAEKAEAAEVAMRERMEWTVEDNAKQRMAVAELKAALRKYGWHEHDCRVELLGSIEVEGTCTCGWSEARPALGSTIESEWRLGWDDMKHHPDCSTWHNSGTNTHPCDCAELEARAALGGSDDR